MDLRIVDSRADRRRFVELPRRFRAAPAYVPPITGEILKLLDPKRNPALHHARQRLWLARDDGGRLVGRIAATYDPRHAESLDEEAGWFGFFDAADTDTAAALIDAAWSWIQEQGAASMLGPADPDTNHECGCLVEGFDHIPYLMMPHNPPHYGGWIEAAGLEKAKDLLAYEAHGPAVRETLKRMEPVVARILERSGIRIESIDKKRLPELLEAVREVYNSAWRDNWGFLPMSAEEFAFEAAGLKMLLRPCMAKVALQGDRPLGFILAVPDANLALHKIGSRLFPFGVLRLPFLLRKVRRVRTIALGVVPEQRRRGLEAALVHHMCRDSLAVGFDCAELSWVLEDNQPMIGLAESLGARVRTRYRLYRRR